MAKTGVSKFRFVSPGIQIAEIDNSQIPKDPEPIGPVIIGRATRGPGLRPVKVDSYSDFVEIFGNAQPGGSPGGDIWRYGGEGLAPTYGIYAAQAWFRNSTPVTFVRLLGKKNDDATPAGKAGWQVGNTWTTDDACGGGAAYGLFLIDSGTSAGLLSANTTGTLAAVFYCESGDVSLSGAFWGVDGGVQESTGGVGVAIESAGTNRQFKAVITSGSTCAGEEIISFDFNKDSKRYIRKVFNTNPTALDVDGRQYNISAQKSYFLGETFDRSVAEVIDNTGIAGSRVVGVTLPLLNTETDWNINRASIQRGTTGWVVSQDLGTSTDFDAVNATKLFRFRTLEGGAWEQKNLKISITNLRAPSNQFEKFGSFTVEIRMADDSDEDPVLVESYTNCSLNKSDPDFIAAKIGDSYSVWVDTDRRYLDQGDYPNRSKYVYMEMNPDEPWLGDSELLPFGYLGPLRFNGFQVSSSSATAGKLPEDGGGPGDLFTNAMVRGPGLENLITASVTDMTASFQFPRTYLRQSTTQGNLASPKEAYFGLDTSLSGTSTVFDESYVDYVLGLPDDYRNDVSGPAITPTTGDTEYSYVFTLDDVTRHTGSTTDAETDAFSNTQAYYLSGSRQVDLSISATSSNGVQNTYKDVIDSGFDQFTMPLWGGFDGVNILERDPFNNSDFGTGDKTEFTSYAYNSIKMAVDACADPEVVECNMMSAPGVTTPGLTNHIMDVCQRRADALAIIDIEGNYVPREDRTTYVADNSDSTIRGNVSDAVNELNDRAINNSYATTYYPWVKIKDQGTGMNVWAPPSVVAIGTYANTDSNFELWFAPAGFTRGGLSEGASGLSVIGVKQRLTSKERDQLYEANINPIASFPAEGIVMFGQKTLQITRSALDRVNVRRLMIHIKKEVSRIAARLLFDQNVTVTWDRFKGQVMPFLDSVRMRLGLEDYRVILDSTTTTPDLIDRNIMYARIYLKPARAIEFIAIDFVITNSGAAFED